MTSVDVGILLGVVTISVLVEENVDIVIIGAVLGKAVDDVSVTEGIGSTKGNNLINDIS